MRNSVALSLPSQYSMTLDFVPAYSILKYGMLKLSKTGLLLALMPVKTRPFPFTIS
jgi:hypothetical protein